MVLKEAREIAKDLRRQEKIGMILGERATAATVLYERIQELEAGLNKIKNTVRPFLEAGGSTLLPSPSEAKARLDGLVTDINDIIMVAAEQGS